MKNILHSYAYSLFNFPSKILSIKQLVLVFGMLFFGSNLVHAQLPIFDNFESGFGNWNDGGNDCRRDNNGFINGDDTVRLRDNSSTSITTSDYFDLSSYSSVTIEFLFTTRNFSTGEDFFVLYDDGGGFVNIGTYAHGSEFVNNNTYTVSITLNSPTYNLSNNARFRIQCDASENSDRLYIDDVNITGVLNPCVEPTNQPTNLTFTNLTNTSLDGSFTAATGSPDGYLVVYNTTGVTPTPSDATTYTIGGTFGGNTVVDNDNDTSFSATGLNPNTTYYFYVFSFDDGCATAPDYLNSNPLAGNITTQFYCIPTGSNSSYYIRLFRTTGGTANIENISSGYSTNGYGDFTSQFATQNAGGTLGFRADFVDGSTSFDGFGLGIWADFNNDGDFDDADEELYISNFYGDPIDASFTIPISVPAGSYRLRIVGDWNDSSPSSCSISSNVGEAEDYTLNVTPLPVCTEPTDQPTNLIFNSTTETTMNVNFTAAASAPDGYLVVMNITGTTPTPVDGTSYTVGGTVGAGNIVLGNDNTTTFNLTGLADNTTYYFYIFSVNNICTGGPDYLLVNPLTGDNATVELCSLSFANGTSDLGCPSVDAGGFGLSGSDPVAINCSNASTTTTLEATYVELGDTSSYTVESIPYNPPFQFGCLENPVSVNVDDVFSDVIDLPFDFCFYGNTYDSCVIGSNGVISFRTSLANGSSGWRTLNNLPSTVNASSFGFFGGQIDYYFGPSIYGVHHDIDPSVGGEIGYQLITLDSGCRALVASWYRVPMYLNNSLLYTGMIVFYEDTNIIEVYVDEKNLDTGWNDGNGTIGIQKDDTEALVAPSRNTLAANWTTSQEAWRFVPSGSSITELKWYENSISAANEIIDPDDDGQITVTPSGTTTYIAEVTYNLCNGATQVETDATIVALTGSKIWDGSESSDWNDPDNWTPSGVPTIANCVTIPTTANNPEIDGSTDGLGYNLTVRDGADLLQQSNSTLTIEDLVTVESTGSYRLENSASLIQINDVANAVDGNFEINRNTDIRENDYVYWSSPVSVFNIQDVSPGTSDGFKYQWLPFVNRTPSFPDPLDFGAWESYNSGAMDVGKGYIVKGPSGHSSTPSTYTATFSGSPNNGDIVQPIQRSTYTGANYFYQPYTGGDILLITSDDDNWNLIGNPYPSAINAIGFLTHPSNTNIDGNVYLWTHGTDIGAGNSDPFYEDYTYNYNVADYIAYNASGTSMPSGFNGNIGSGQGFFVLMNDLASTSETVTFNNAMRSSAYGNNQFYRGTSETSDSSDTASRIWLDYISSNGSTNTTLVAYVDGATNGQDRMFDAINTRGNGLNLYSMIGETSYIIQGRQWPYSDTDEVPLGINITQSGIQTIAINTIEGIDPSQDIYLEDKELNIIHNLKISPYVFTTDEGIFNERFVLRFNNNLLGIDDNEAQSSVIIKSIDNAIDVKSNFSNIKTFEIFDVTGRTIHKNLKVDNTHYNYPTYNISSGTFIVKIKLANGATKSKKLII